MICFAGGRLQSKARRPATTRPARSQRRRSVRDAPGGRSARGPLHAGSVPVARRTIQTRSSRTPVAIAAWGAIRRSARRAGSSARFRARATAHRRSSPGAAPRPRPARRSPSRRREARTADASASDSANSPCASAAAARVRPQAGQATPVTRWKRQRSGPPATAGSQKARARKRATSPRPVAHQSRDSPTSRRPARCG